MHPRLEQRLKSGFLALGIGVGSLGLSGCATNNPALNAFMNYGVAPVIAAEAGRGQVIVNENGEKPYQRGWRVFITKDIVFDEYGFLKQAIDPRTTFSKDESFYVGISNEQGLRQGFRAFFSSDGINWEMKGHSGTPVEFFSLKINSGELKPGSYFLQMKDGINRVVGQRTLEIRE